RLRTDKAYFSTFIKQRNNFRYSMYEQPRPLFTGGDGSLNTLPLTNVTVDAEDCPASPIIDKRKADKELERLTLLADIGSLKRALRVQRMRKICGFMGQQRERLS